jgi:pimeloyl-ACP methyl ester carboxylesterase
MTTPPAGGFILVHGGEHGPWCWDEVVPLLVQPAVAVALPGRGTRAGDTIRFGLDDSARAVAEAVRLAAFDPCIVVCHSLGGLAVLAAEPLHPAPPAHRVFVSAVTPKPGTSALDALPPLFRAYLRMRLRPAVRRHQAIHLLPRPLAGAIWFHDLDPAVRDRATRRLCAESPLIPMEAVPEIPTPTDTATYLLLTRDRAVRPQVQRRMARNRGITNVRELDAAHEVMLSDPGRLADELNRIARVS